MSIERDLLILITKRFKEEFNNTDWYSESDKELLAEIEKVLEPVAWTNANSYLVGVRYPEQPLVVINE